MSIKGSLAHTRKMNIYNKIKGIIQNIIQSSSGEFNLPEGAPVDRINVEPPKDPTMGDLSTNAAMVLAKPAGMNPRALGEWLAAELAKHDDIASVEVAGPGFVNIRMSDTFWHRNLNEILKLGTAFGDSEIGNREKINIEYVSANPTGPMHVGHGRGAVVGDVLANLLEKAGYTVSREYYINDAGAQVDTLARSVFLRYREALGEAVSEIPEGLYPGEYLIETGKKLADRDGEKWRNADEADWLPALKSFAIDDMMALIRVDLAALGVTHDVFTSEKSLIDAGAIDDVLGELEGRDLIYTGVLEPPKGKKPDDWEERPQLLFRATGFGDDTDRPLKKSDGSNTYFASDIAYHRDKNRRGYNRMIDVWGEDHKGYVKRMQAAVKAVTGGEGNLEVRLCNLVNLLEDGEPVKMSKRAGTFVTLRDVIDMVGRDVVRFIMLTRNNEALLDFDVSKVKEQSKDNPVFYVQYAHARICSVLRNAAEAFPSLSLDDSTLAGAEFSELDEKGGLDLVKLLCGWPRVVEAAAESHEPHRIAFFLNDVAAAFHAFWNRGNDDESLRFIVPDSAEKTQARIALARAVAVVIASGLQVIGVEPAKEMR